MVAIELGPIDLGDTAQRERPPLVASFAGELISDSSQICIEIAGSRKPVLTEVLPQANEMTPARIMADLLCSLMFFGTRDSFSKFIRRSCVT
jgi:hypothetical protein